MRCVVHAVIGLGIVAGPGIDAADAGCTHLGWLSGAELVPERGTEVENWIVEENKKGDDRGSARLQASQQVR